MPSENRHKHSGDAARTEKPAKKMTKEENRAALRWIMSLARPEFPRILFIIIGEALWAMFGTVTALFSKEIVNAAADKDYDHMVRFLIIYLVTALSLLGVNALMRYVTEKCRARLEIHFRDRIFSGMLGKSYPALSVYHTGDLVNRLTGDVGVISDAATSILPNVVMMAVRLIFAMGVLIYMQWTFAIFFFFSGLFILVLSRVVKGHIQNYHRDMQQADGKMRSFWQEIFENLSVIKAFAGEDKATERSDVLMNDHFVLRMKRSLLGTFSMLSTRLVIRLGHLFAIGYGAFCMFNGTMDYGTLTALTQLVSQVQQPFASMSGIMPQYYAALASANRLMEIEKLSDDSTDGDRLDAAAAYKTFDRIEVRDVDFAYDEENPVLIDCDATIHKGDFISITGMSGIGKSTLFKVLLDIYPRRAGIARMIASSGEETDLNGLTRTLFAYVPQGNMLFSGTIRENLLFLTHKDEPTEREIHDALTCACAESFIRELPDGLDSKVGENGVGLSEGQIQRLSVARAILSGAPILMLDEATSALDEETEAAMLSNIKALQNRTCLIVTHKRAALDICNRHFVMRDHAIVESDDPLQHTI